MCNTLFFICFKVNLLFVIEGKALACESRSFFVYLGSTAHGIVADDNRNNRRTGDVGNRYLL